MKLTGQKLKEKRESSRLTISEVSLATKINPKVLNAMENGDAEHLPAKTFLRGFVRAYAGFLKMNVAEVLELFNKEINEGAVVKEVIETSPADMTLKLKPKKETSSTVDVNGEGSGTFRMFVIGGILVLIVLIIGVRSIVQKYERERNVDAASDLSASKVTPLEDKITPAPATPPPVDASTVSPPAAEPVAPAAVGPTGPPPVAPTPVVAQPVVETKVEPPPETKPPETKPETKPEVAKVDAPTPPQPPPPPPAPKAADKGKRHEIILEALDKVDVSYKLNGQSKKIPMAPGQVHTIVTEEPISFDVSDGGALNITDNGNDKGPAGDLGHRKQVSVP